MGTRSEIDCSSPETYTPRISWATIHVRDSAGKTLDV
jgi:hypothetical protein